MDYKESRRRQGIGIEWTLSLYGAHTACLLQTRLKLKAVTNFQFLLQPHQQYNITQYEEPGFSKLTP